MGRPTPLLFLLSAALVPSLASALTLTTPYDLGDNVASITTPNGDTGVRGTPSVIDVTDARTQTLQAALANDFPTLVPDPSTATIGAALPGEVRVRPFDVGSSLDASSGRYYIGSAFRLDYVDPNTPSNLRWSVLSRFVPQGNSGGESPFAEAFAARPTFYSDAEEAGQHTGGAYVLDSNLYELADPGNYDYGIEAFLISTTQDANGTFTSIVIHDGVNLPVSVHLAAAPVPEPATLAVLGVGAAALLRRRRR